ncbi:MAG: glycosyltransferase family 2 protein [Chitinophagaceae bacterium]|nr:glycosyltransferase family 2 protein [Chitinophagaceae bacterium]
MVKPFVSICIPAYKRPEFLVRLLDSIGNQTYSDFEVVITDDSSDESVAHLIKLYSSRFTIHYYKNPKALGTPANWNAAIRLARGEWIKLMHDDDWFENSNSLEIFFMATKTATSPFIFSGFRNLDIETNHSEQYVLTAWHAHLLRKNPFNLLKKNFIGHPSTTFIKNDTREWYDENLKWVVDIEFYTRTLLKTGFYAIRQPLVNLGISSHQVTKTAFRQPGIEIPENLYLLNKISPAALKALFAYDYFWRFIRNLSIRNTDMIQTYCPEYSIPAVIKLMISYQKHLPAGVLKIGFVSKSIMLISYLHGRSFGMLKK